MHYNRLQNIHNRRVRYYSQELPGLSWDWKRLDEELIRPDTVEHLNKPKHAYCVVLTVEMRNGSSRDPLTRRGPRIDDWQSASDAACLIVLGRFCDFSNSQSGGTRRHKQTQSRVFSRGVNLFKATVTIMHSHVHIFPVLPIKVDKALRTHALPSALHRK